MTQSSLVIIVTTPPHYNATVTAISYVEAALKQKDINVLGVFFYQAGVLNANQYVKLPNDECQTLNRWQALAQQYQLSLHLCITAGEKHGLSDEIDLTDSMQSNILPEFTISGLGELVTLTSQADRVVQL